MLDEYSFKPHEVTVDNIKKLSKNQSELEERRICEISEHVIGFCKIMDELNRGGMDLCETLSILSDSKIISDTSLHDNRLSDNEPILSLQKELLSELDKVAFCHLLAEKLRNLGRTMTEQDFLIQSNTPETFVYIKNTFADEAYDVFSQDFAFPRVKYAKDFKEALSLVSCGEVGYCLLPLEDRGVRIRTVEELIFNGDFKINSVTPVFGYDGIADMKYCLVSSSFLISDYTPEDDRYLEIRLSGGNADELKSLLLSAGALGADLYRINTVSFSTADQDRSYYSIIFKRVGSDFVELLTYLTLFVENSTTLGIYKNLE